MSTISSNWPIGSNWHHVTVCIFGCICTISRTQSASETAVDPTNESETAADPTVESPTAAIPAPQSRTESRGSLLRRLRRTSDEANLWSESHQPQQEQTPASGQNGIATWRKMDQSDSKILPGNWCWSWNCRRFKVEVGPSLFKRISVTWTSYWHASRCSHTNTQIDASIQEDSLENFLSDLMDASDDGNPKSSHRQTDDGKPSPPKRRVRHKSKGPRPTCIEDGACDPSYFRSQEDFENFWILGRWSWAVMKTLWRSSITFKNIYNLCCLIGALGQWWVNQRLELTPRFSLFFPTTTFKPE